MSLNINKINFTGRLTVSALTGNHKEYRSENITVDTDNIKAIKRASSSTILELNEPVENSNLKSLSILHGIQTGSFNPARHDSIINAYNVASQNPHINIEI